MRDYISRSAARDDIAAARDRRIADKPYGWEWEYNGYNGAIVALPMPTEDLEPVVRCRNCAVPHNRRTGCPVLGGKI